MHCSWNSSDLHATESGGLWQISTFENVAVSLTGQRRIRRLVNYHPPRETLYFTLEKTVDRVGALHCSEVEEDECNLTFSSPCLRRRQMPSSAPHHEDGTLRCASGHPQFEESAPISPRLPQQSWPKSRVRQALSRFGLINKTLKQIGDSHRIPRQHDSRCFVAPAQN